MKDNELATLVRELYTSVLFYYVGRPQCISEVSNVAFGQRGTWLKDSGKWEDDHREAFVAGTLPRTVMTQITEIMQKYHIEAVQPVGPNWPTIGVTRLKAIINELLRKVRTARSNGSEESDDQIFAELGIILSIKKPIKRHILDPEIHWDDPFFWYGWTLSRMTASISEWMKIGEEHQLKLTEIGDWDGARIYRLYNSDCSLGQGLHLHQIPRGQIINEVASLAVVFAWILKEKVEGVANYNIEAFDRKIQSKLQAVKSLKVRIAQSSQETLRSNGTYGPRNSENYMFSSVQLPRFKGKVDGRLRWFFIIMGQSWRES